LKKRVFLGLLVLANIFTLAHAQSMPLKTAEGGEMGVQISNYMYQEEVNGSSLMSNQGSKIGLTGNLTLGLSNSWFLRGDGRYASGNVNYTRSGTKSSNPDALAELRMMAGKDFEIGNYLLSPYAGVGARFLSNDLRGLTSSGAAGYRRESWYTYLPLGVTHRFAVDGKARISTSLEYDFLIEGRQRSRTTDFGATSDLNNLQRKGSGARLSVSYETENWSAGVFYHYWDIEDSEKGTYTDPSFVYVAIEPHNTTKEFGAQVMYRFR
jgi:hypothetical protein